VVLQVHEPSSEKPSWRDGVELGLDVYLAAIDQLAADGIIDPKRVGISGYSDSAWLVGTAITRAPSAMPQQRLPTQIPAPLRYIYSMLARRL
jgi:hypothetical protein